MLERETGAGTGYFYFMASTEQDWDALEFILNGRVLGKWSGRVNWTKFEFVLEAGNNRLEWRYRKDSSTFAGMDAVFIDNVFIPEVPVVEPAACNQALTCGGGCYRRGLAVDRDRRCRDRVRRSVQHRPGCVEQLGQGDD